MSDASVIFDTDVDATGLKSGLTKLKSSIGTFAKGAGIAIGAAAVGLGILAKASLTTGMTFDSAMSQVQATMNATKEETADLRVAAQEMGETTKFTATQAAEAENYLALAGKNAEQSIAALPGVLNLAAAGGMDLAYATDLATDAMSALGLADDQLEGFSDQMARTAQKSNTSVSQLGEAVLTVGGTAKGLKDGTAELNAQLGILANAGIKGSEGGTIFRNTLLSLSAPTKQASKQLKSLGVDVYDSSGNLRTTNEIFADLNTALSDMSDAERNAALSNIFNKRDLKGVQALLAGSVDSYDALYDSIVNSAGASAEMSATMLDNLEGDATIFKSAAEGLGIAFYDGFSSGARGVVQYGTGLIGQLTEAMKSGGVSAMVAALGDILGDVVSKASSYAPQLIKMAVGLVKSLLSGLKQNAKVIAKGLAETFKEAVLGLIELAPDLIDVGLELLIELADSLADELPDIMVSLMDALFNIIVKLVTNAPRLLEAGAKLVQGIMQGFKQAYQKLMPSLQDMIRSSMDNMKLNIKPNISEEQQAAITAAINAGIDASKQVIAIKVKAKTDTATVISDIEAAFADGKLTGKESNALGDQMDAYVDEAMTQATTYVTEKTAEWEAALTSMVGQDGVKLYTDEEAAALTSSMSDKVNELSTELQETYDAYNTLKDKLDNPGYHATAEEIALLEELATKILGIKAEIEAATNEVIQVAEARTRRVLGGRGSMEDFGVALGYTQDQYATQLADQQVALNTAVAAYEAMLQQANEDWENGLINHQEYDNKLTEVTDAQDALFTSDAARRAQLAADYTAQLSEIYSGMAEANPEAAAQISGIVDLYQQYANLTAKGMDPSSFNLDDLKTLNEQIIKYFGEEVAYDPEQMLAGLSGAFGNADAFQNVLGGWILKVMGGMETEMGSAASNISDNPLLAVLQTMFAEGSFDDIDLSAVDESLQEAFLAIDYSQNGINIVDGSLEGAYQRADELTADDWSTVKEDFLATLHEAFESHSPARVMFPLGEDIVDGLVQGINDNREKVDAVGYSLVSSIASGIQRNYPSVAGAIRSVVAVAATLAASTAYASGQSIGAALGQGVVAGILTMVTAAAAAAASLVAAAYSGARDKGGIHSPSKLFYDGVGQPIGMGTNNGFVDVMNNVFIPNVRKSVSDAARAGRDAMNGTLLGKVQAISGFNIPNFAGIGNAILRGSLLTGAGSTVNTTNSNSNSSFTQNITFESTMQAPDEIARTLRRQAGYGLAGAKKS